MFTDPTKWLLMLEARKSVLSQLLRQIDRTGKLLYNEKLTLGERYFKDSTLIRNPVELPVLLETITRQDLFYVRNLVPMPIFTALVKLHNLLFYCENLESAIKFDVIPRADHLSMIKKEFDCLEVNCESDRKSSANSRKNTEKVVRIVSAESRLTTPAKMSRPVTEITNKSTDERFFVLKPELTPQIVHNYSTQTKNYSVEMVEKFYNKYRKKTPYRSRSESPKKSSGWVFPGVKTSLNSQYTKSMQCLPEYRKQDLRDHEWHEAELFSNIMKPTLPERDSDSGWISSQDFKVPRKSRDTSPTEKCSVLLGDRDSTSPVRLRSSPEFKVWRKSASTELTLKGRMSSCQLDKLEGLRKGEISNNYFYADTPALSVLHSSNESYGQKNKCGSKMIYMPVDDMKKSLVRFQICR
ncbi:hypothetical protein Ciccas_007465 [Cichlidogyrus casuarinus]|uniref:Uncharacterized protein n=1 Tax=Cichlidogyrus casuarinus TaxID=1844966 RepID=A0ABD2Q3Y7_9PLAT